MIEEAYIGAGAENRAGSRERRCTNLPRAGERQDKLPGATARGLLALRIRVGKQPADGQKQNGAQAQSQPRRHQQTRSLAYGNGSNQQKNRASPRGHPSLPLMAKTTKISNGKKIWTRNSTPIHRPSGIDQPRIQGL